MRVLMFSHLYLPHIGGVERHIYYVTKELVARGHEVRLITSYHTDDLPQREEIDHLTVWRVHFRRFEKIPFSRRINTFLQIWRLRDLIKWADVVHVHDHAIFIYWYLPFLFMFPKKPAYITMHGYEDNRVLRREVLLKKMASSLSRGTICVGKFIEDKYHVKANRVIYGGVDPRWSGGEVSQKDIPILYIGRLDPDKPVFQYLEVVRVLQKEFGYTESIHFLGDGKLSHELEEIVNRHGIKAYFYGAVEDPKGYIKRARMVFADSYLAILEAFVLKVPVFALYHVPFKLDYLTSIPDWEKLMVVSGDSKELAWKVSKFLDAPEAFQDMIKQAYRFSMENTWGRIANIYEELYRENSK